MFRALVGLSIALLRNAQFDEPAVFLQAPNWRIPNEPVTNGEVDWKVAFDIARDRGDAERKRLERVESKIAPIIAGAIATLALFVQKSASALDLSMACLLVIPILMLLSAFRTTEYQEFPDLETVASNYEWYPQTILRSGVYIAAEVVGINAVTIDNKARALNRAMGVLMIIVSFILVTRLGESVYHERHPSKTAGAASRGRISSRASAASTSSNA